MVVTLKTPSFANNPIELEPCFLGLGALVLDSLLDGADAGVEDSGHGCFWESVRLWSTDLMSVDSASSLTDARFWLVRRVRIGTP